MRRTLFVLLVAACGDNLDPAAGGEARSGSRLRVERYLYPDGTTEVEPGQFFDADRDEACHPAVWSDGQTYCTPIANEAVYTSADCTALIGRVAEADREPRYFLRTYTLQDVEHPSRLFAASTPTQTPPQIWRLRSGICFGPEAPTAGDRYYTLGPEVPREELVQLKHATSTEASRIEVTSLTSDDGLRVPVELVDRVLELPCDLDLDATGGAIHCVPRGTREAHYYADASCNVHELEVLYGDPLPPIVWARDEVTGCTDYHELGGIVVGPLFRVIAGTCQPVNAPSDASFYRLEQPFALASLSRSREHRDGGRLLAIHAFDDELTVRDPRLFDTELSTECRRAKVAPGEFRCVPVTETRVTTLFADETCATELLVAMIDTRVCALRAPYAMRSDIDATTFHALGEAHPGPAYVLSTGDRCVPFIPNEPHQALYDVGPAIATDDLARAILVPDL